MLFRLAPDQMKRLTLTAKYKRQTKQSFVQEVVLAEIAAIEESRHLKRPVNDEDTLPLRQKEPVVEGLGLAEKMKWHRESDPAPIAPLQNQGQVVVNVGNGSGSASSGDVIDRLAAYIVAGRDFERDTRTRTAVGILQASAATEEERKVLAARLDEAIAAKKKTQPSESGGVARVARFAFDKLFGGG
jgi:hypothetical protein